MTMIAIASGKGGTGKTTVAVNLASYLAQQHEWVNLLDCDVEEPNDHLFFKIKQWSRENVIQQKPKWNADSCTQCGRCVEACQFNALALIRDEIIVFEDLCHSCGVCSKVCPTNSYGEKDCAIGEIYSTSGNSLPFFFSYGCLGIGQIATIPIIRQLKRKIRFDDITILDAAPGTGCPVVECFHKATIALLVTEPTPFGLHDLKLAAELSLKLKIPTGIIINRSESDDCMISKFAEENEIPIIGRIPFDRRYAESYSRGELLIDHFPEVHECFAKIAENIKGFETLPIPEFTATFEHEILPEPTIKPNKKQLASNNKDILVLSGKGGTGKTTITAALASQMKNSTFVDCDVDASDLHLLLQPKDTKHYAFEAGVTAKISDVNCVNCNLCHEECHFDAITCEYHVTVVDESRCEGCGMCQLICQNDAITMIKNSTGEWNQSTSLNLPLIHARLNIGEENSGKLVAKVKAEALRSAQLNSNDYLLGDGPPGTGCPVISSISNTDLVIIVTEPTLAGKHDFERVIKLIKHFETPSALIINKADLNDEVCDEIEKIANSANIKTLRKIPFDRNVHQALMQGKTIIEWKKGPAYNELKTLWKDVDKLLNKK